MAHPTRWLWLGLAAVLAVPAGAQREITDPKLGKLTFDVRYGPHRRHKLDFYRATSDMPTPVVVYFHGGGFRTGSKRHALSWFSHMIQRLLEQGVSFAAANYRYLPQGELEGVLRDGARVVQFLRHAAGRLNVDPECIGAFGVSAGAGMALWLAAHDDLRRPDAKDPVLRQSSRIAAAGLLSGQFTYDLRKWHDVIGEPPAHVAVQFRAEMARLKRRTGGLRTAEARSILATIDLIELLTADDPPLWIFGRRPLGPARSYDHYVHHPKHGLALAKRCAAVGVPHVARIDPAGPRENARTVQDDLTAFLRRHLTPRASTGTEK